MSSSTAEAELNEDEGAGLELIRESGGIHQSDFWNWDTAKQLSSPRWFNIPNCYDR